MDATIVWGLTSDELASAVTAADPGAFLVPARILRRVIKQHRHIDDLLRVPHRKSYVIGREALLQIVERSELGLDGGATLPEVVILLPRPEAEQLAAMTRPRALVKYWRLLFHARVHVELDRLVAEGKLSSDIVRERIAQIGSIEFDEIRAVLRQEDMLLPPVVDLSTYIEFVAVFLELKHFAHRLLADYFPSITQWAAIESIVTQDWNADHWFAATRPTGSPDPHERAVEDDEALSDLRVVAQSHPRKQSERAYCRIMERADRARSKDNDVRSAMFRWRAALVIGPKLARAARDAARVDIEHLSQRLARALELPDGEVATWSELLLELLPGAASGIWTAEARFLYDLQKVCIDHERGVFTLDTMRWLWNRCRGPLRRSLPSQRDVLMSKHLFAAIHRLGTVRMATMHRDRLSSLLRDAKEHAEGRLRTSFRPRFEAALDEVGLVANNPPEQIARRKLIEELLDRVVERGYLNIGDLRDAISRNQLKLRDVPDAAELYRGDQLLRADRKLGESLEGVYRPGEIYLRWPQSLSSIAFGTPVGRWLTKYVALPYGGAFMVLEFFQHLLHAPFDWMGFGHARLRSIETVALFGTFLLMLYHTGFRRAVTDGLNGLYQVFYQPLIAVPLRIIRSPLVQKIIKSDWFRTLFRFGLKPAALAGMVALITSIAQRQIVQWSTAFAMFLAANLLINSRWGRILDEMVTDWAVRSWNQFRIKILAGLLHAIVDFFHQVLETIERFLYTVDEWLRFRTGESDVATGIKAVLGFVWFFINYFIRFCVTLLVEPQINPVKHFPVVTVSHKVILPLGPFFVAQFEPYLGSAEANALVWSTIWLIPGVFGFLIWELKENWRLYAANRAPTLRPAQVGHHGESMVGLLRPGFHSGTVPKLFLRLRRADRKAQATGSWAGPRSYHDKLNDVREAVWRFVERDLIALVELSPHWRQAGLYVSDVRLGNNNIRLSICGRAPWNEPLGITLQEKHGWLTARLSRPAWFDGLAPEQARPLRTAITGWFKLCGVELLHEQIETCFEPMQPEYDLYDEGIVVWPQEGDDRVILYQLRDDGRGGPLVSPSSPSSLPTLDRQRLVFAAAPLRWRAWIESWQREVSEEFDPAVIEQPTALPRPESAL
jgi:hypothetical protein